MDINIVKTSEDTGAVFIKYQTHPISPINEVTLPFTSTNNRIKFEMTEETLYDLVNLIKRIKV